MSTLKGCIEAAIKEGKMTRKAGWQFLQDLKKVEEQMAKNGRGGVQDYLISTSAMAEDLLSRARNNKRSLAITLLTVDKAWEDVSLHSKGRFWGMLSLVGENVWGKHAPTSIPSRSKAVFNIAVSHMSEMLPEFRSRWAGLKTSIEMPNLVVDEILGKDTANSLAKEGAKGYKAASEWLMQGLKDAGVAVKDVTEWVIPQRIDPGAVRHVGMTNYVNDMTERWKNGDLILEDWSDTSTKKGVLDFNEDALQGRQILNKSYDNITTNGAGTLKVGEFMGTTLSEKYGQKRAFKWSGADAWKRFNTDYGVGEAGVGDLLIQHLQDLARDVAVAQALGPRPDLAFKMLMQLYTQSGGGKFGSHIIDSTYYHASGQSAMPVSENFAHAAQGIKSHLTAAQLPLAIVSAISDFAFTRSTASWNGLDSTRVLGNYLTSWSKDIKGTERTKFMIANGLGLEAGIRSIGDHTRDIITEVYQRSSTGGGIETGLSAFNRIAGKEAEFVLTVQGLPKHTQLIRDNLGMGFLANHGAMAHLDLDQMRNLNPDMAGWFDTYGITSKDWDLIRASAVPAEGFAIRGAEIIGAAKLAREGNAVQREAATKYMMGVSAEAYRAAPESNTVMRGMLLGKTNPGTLGGETLRASMMFKGFPIAVLMMHGLRAVEGLADAVQGKAGWNRGTYGAALIATMIPLGAASVQIHNLLTGKDVEPMDTPGFWGRAAAKAGVAGVIGDWIKNALDAGSAKDLIGLMAPPVAGLGADVAMYGVKNMQRSLTQGQQSKWAYEGVRLLDRYTADTIFTKTAIDRLVWDQLKKMSDPAAASLGFQSLINRAHREQNTQYWHRPGSIAPDRGPNMSNMLSP